MKIKKIKTPYIYIYCNFFQKIYFCKYKFKICYASVSKLNLERQSFSSKIADQIHNFKFCSVEIQKSAETKIFTSKKRSQIMSEWK